MSDDEVAIRQAAQDWSAATRRGDLDTILDLMTDDVVFTVCGQEPFGKDAFAKAFGTMGSVTIDGEPEIVELQVLGNWAFTRNHIDLTATPAEGDPVRRSGYTLSLFRKEADGKWRLARDANLLTVRD